MRKFEFELNDQEKIMLSRLYKLDRKIDTFMQNHSKMSMNELLPKTDFIKKANELYQIMSPKLIKISLERTKHTQNLVDIAKILEKKS